MKCEQTEQRADWYLTTQENKWIDEHARLNVDRQDERNEECAK